jgi:hypothetical protein
MKVLSITCPYCGHEQPITPEIMFISNQFCPTLAQATIMCLNLYSCGKKFRVEKVISYKTRPIAEEKVDDCSG